MFASAFTAEGINSVKLFTAPLEAVRGLFPTALGSGRKRGKHRAVKVSRKQQRHISPYAKPRIPVQPESSDTVPLAVLLDPYTETTTELPQPVAIRAGGTS